jgi:hypothetical protein
MTLDSFHKSLFYSLKIYYQRAYLSNGSDKIEMRSLKACLWIVSDVKDWIITSILMTILCDHNWPSISPTDHRSEILNRQISKLNRITDFSLHRKVILITLSIAKSRACEFRENTLKWHYASIFCLICRSQTEKMHAKISKARSFDTPLVHVLSSPVGEASSDLRLVSRGDFCWEPSWLYQPKLLRQLVQGWLECNAFERKMHRSGKSIFAKIYPV